MINFWFSQKKNDLNILECLLVFRLPATQNKHVFCSCLVWGFMNTLIWLVHVTIVFLYSTNTVDASEIWIMRISHDFSCDFLTIRWLPYFWTITRYHQWRCPRRTPCALAEALELSTSKLEINAPRPAERPFTPAGVPPLHFLKVV